MRLESFRIKNFRSIKDSGICYLSQGITILAGKNESGKTNILEGLEKFNKEVKFKQADEPLYSVKVEPIKIELHFKIDSQTVQNILKEHDIEIKLKESEEDYRLDITRSNATPDYETTGEIFEILEKVEEKRRKEILKKINNTIRKIYALLKNHDAVKTSEPVKLSDEDSSEKINSKINSLVSIIDGINPNISKQKDIKKLNGFKNKILDEKSKINIEPVIKEIKQKIIAMAPRMVLFNSFDDILPSEVPIAEIKNTEMLNSKKYRNVKDFKKLSGLDIQALSNDGDKQMRKKIVNKASQIYSEDFGEYWHQDPVKIRADCDGPFLQFFVQDVILNEGKTEIDETPYKPEQRSKGLQWYLSFFLRLKAEGSEKGNIILIDEPGLYLHARAQQDVLKLLEELSKDNQIIFTTHSPYLIDPDKLSRVRLLIRNNTTREATIQNNFNKGADRDTLTPIITAIGLDLSKGIAFPVKKNVVVEGVSDYYYMEAMLHFLKEKKEYNFPEDISIIPCIGHTAINSIVSLLIGWQLRDYKIVLDKKGTTKTYNKLVKDGVPKERIIFIGKTDSESIESLFSKEDVDEYNINGKEFSKTITSKQFFEKITHGDNVKLSEETIKNFREKLFDKIKENYSNDNDKVKSISN